MKSSTILNTLMFVDFSISFKFSKMFGVQKRWQNTGARSLFSKEFKISSNCETVNGRKLRFSRLEMLLFNTSCQTTMSVVSERSFKSKFCTIFFGFFMLGLRLMPGIEKILSLYRVFSSMVKVSRAWCKELAVKMKTMCVFFYIEPKLF